jgi:hypothetical protein
MVRKKRLNADHTVEMMLDKDSNNNLITVKQMVVKDISLLKLV